MPRFQRCPELSYELITRKLSGHGQPACCIAKVDREDTSAESLRKFFCALAELRRDPGVYAAINMMSVGLRCDDRRSQYDLWWFRQEPMKVFAIDVHDYSYVCSVIVDPAAELETVAV